MGVGGIQELMGERGGGGAVADSAECHAEQN